MIVPPMPPIAATIAVMEIQRVWGRRTSADERDVRRRSRVDVRVDMNLSLDVGAVPECRRGRSGHVQPSLVARGDHRVTQKSAGGRFSTECCPRRPTRQPQGAVRGPRRPPVPRATSGRPGRAPRVAYRGVTDPGFWLCARGLGLTRGSPAKLCGAFNHGPLSPLNGK